jgi:hypothetical protein
MTFDESVHYALLMGCVAIEDRKGIHDLRKWVREMRHFVNDLKVTSTNWDFDLIDLADANGAEYCLKWTWYCKEGRDEGEEVYKLY